MLAVLPGPVAGQIRTPGHTHSGSGTVGLQPKKPLEESEGSLKSVVQSQHFGAKEDLMVSP